MCAHSAGMKTYVGYSAADITADSNSLAELAGKHISGAKHLCFPIQAESGAVEEGH